MRRIRLLLAALLFVVLPASGAISTPPSATPPDTPEKKPVPQSIWVVGGDRAAVHQQSQWRCPAQYGEFQRNDLYVFDTYGLDVDCNYLSANGHGDVTLYLTKATGGNLDEAFAAAKEALVKRSPEAVALPEAQQKTFASAWPWLHQLYAIGGGSSHDGVWYAWLGDWMVEIRATYPAADEEALLTLMSRMTADMAASAGGHLERCARSGIPLRDGHPITDKDKLAADVFMFGVMAGPDAIKTTDGTGQETGSKTLPQPNEWCPEKGILVDDVPMLLWHAVSPTGETQAFDRISVMTLGPAPALECDLNSLGALLGGASTDGKAEYTVSMDQGDEIFLYAVFDNRPDENALGRLMADWFHNKAKPLAKVNPKTNNITVFFDPGQKD